MWRETHGRVLQNLDNRGVLQKTPLGEGADMFRSSDFLISKFFVGGVGVYFIAERARVQAVFGASDFCGHLIIKIGHNLIFATTFQTTRVRTEVEGGASPGRPEKLRTRTFAVLPTKS